MNAASPLFSNQGRLIKTDEELKRLTFVRNYSGFCLSKGYTLASCVYNTGLAYTPESVNTSIRAVEQAVTEYSCPIVTAVQDQSARALYHLDHQVTALAYHATSVHVRS